jgi:hypothetical protein
MRAESQRDGGWRHSPCPPRVSKSHPTLHRASIRDSVDEALVLLGVRTLGDSDGLSVCLCHKSGRAQVGYPNLGRPRTLLAQLLAMLSNLFTRPQGNQRKEARGSGAVSCPQGDSYLTPSPIKCFKNSSLAFLSLSLISLILSSIFLPPPSQRSARSPNIHRRNSKLTSP